MLSENIVITRNKSYEKQTIDVDNEITKQKYRDDNEKQTVQITSRARNKSKILIVKFTKHQ